MSTRADRMAKLDALLDRAEILDCIHRYTRGMDRLDRELVRSAYHDGAIDEHGGFVGPVGDFLDWAFAYHARQVRHQHYVTNSSVELDGDAAHAETYYAAFGTVARNRSDTSYERPLVPRRAARA